MLYIFTPRLKTHSIRLDAHVSDEVYAEANKEFSDEELIDPMLVVTTINTWNRINLAFPNAVGTYKVGQFGYSATVTN